MIAVLKSPISSEDPTADSLEPLSQQISISTEVSAPVGHWRLRLPAWERVWSKETFRIFGLNPDGPVEPPAGKLDLFHPDDRARLYATALTAARENEDWSCEARIIRPSGEQRTVLIKGFCERLGPAFGELFGVIIDVTEFRATTRRASENERRYRLLANHSTDLIIHADLTSRRHYVSPSSITVLGFDPAELLGSTAFELLHPDDREPFRWFLDSLAELDRSRLITRQRYRHRAGHYIWAETTYSVIRDPATSAATGYVAAIRDISERHAAEERAHHVARHDSLTQLPNRRFFQEELERRTSLLKASKGPVALFWMDLNRFKGVNDTFGHPMGDHLLCVVADRLKSLLRDEDFVARLGGDEFAILRSDCITDDAMCAFARELVEKISLPAASSGFQLQVGVSVGIVTISAHDDSVELIFQRADLALYHAKARYGEQIVVFHEEMDNTAQRRLGLEIDMQKAIEDEDFRLEYQPIVDASSGRILACEALMRWSSAKGEPISPSEFIAVAEDSGLIIQLGKWALERACMDATRWPSEIQVAVNVSARQLRDPSIVDSVTEALCRAQLDPARLVLEVTESVLLSDAETVLAIFHRLCECGVKFSLDDFGTGYSSLSYLHLFPFDKMKIDKSFVSRLDDERTSMITSAICDLGRRLGKQVIAEGVETREQLLKLRDLGCPAYQGFFFSRSLPPEAIGTLQRQTSLVA